MRIGAQIEETIRAHQPKLRANEVKRKTVDSLRRAAVPEPEAARNSFRISSPGACASAR